ncbi:MAG TPA: DUF1993 domain-containing protein [Steroidobacteraceae bacterium]|nr:DUF1993 domain-containing protein [Steroidobacteraceae bacterium]
MKISVHTMAVDSFVPMLESLAAMLGKGAACAAQSKIDLVNARLAPDMYGLGKQVELACHFAEDGVQRLLGKPARPAEEKTRSLEELQELIAATVKRLKATEPTALEGRETADCSIPTPAGAVIRMNGLQFLRDWALPHFYFHVVTAYGILRNSGVALGKQDYLSHIESLINPGK